MSARRGMSAHPINRGSASYLALKLCLKVVHNPNIDLLILLFACTLINKKLCLKMCLFTKIAMFVVHLHSGIVYSKLCTATKLCIFKQGFNHVKVAGKIINASSLLLE